MRPGVYVALVLVLFSLGGVLYSLQLKMDMSRDEKGRVEEFMYLPRAEYLRTASLGYENLAADLLWLKTVQHIGEKKISGEGYEWIYKALDTVTTLDPKFVAAYEMGGLVLTIQGENAGLSNKLLMKGVENNPEVWQFPFYLGFNSFFYFKDFKAAARYIEQASHVPGSPSYLPLLASRLYVQAEDPAYALQFLQKMLEATQDEGLRKGLTKRANMLRAVVTARELQKVVDSYSARFRHPPESLSSLVEAGIIDRVPEEPNGGYYYIDTDGKVNSSKVKETLGVHTKR